MNNDNHMLFLISSIFLASALFSGSGLGQDTLFSWCLSPPRCKTGYWRTLGENIDLTEDKSDINMNQIQHLTYLSAFD